MSMLQSLKSANQVRVDISQAERMGSERLLLGDSGCNGLCGAGWNDLQHDQYFRPVSQNTLRLDSVDCNGGGQNSAGRRIEVENLERPYVPVCAAGFRGGDTMGVGRNLQPEGLYDGSARGAWVRHYKTPNNIRPHQSGKCGCCTTPQHAMPKYDLSMDAKHRVWLG